MSHSAEEKKDEIAAEKETKIKEEKKMKLEERVKKLENEVSTLKGASIRTRQSEKKDVHYKAFMNYLRTGKDIPAEFKTDYPIIAGEAAQGGILIPPTFYKKVIEKLVQYSPVRQYATVIRTNAREIKIPVENAGITVAWPGETGTRTHAITDSDFFDQITLTQYSQTALIKVSRQVLSFDDTGLEDYVVSLMARYMSQSEGTKFIKGDGTEEPIGILHSNILERVETEEAGVVGPDDLIALYYSVPDFYRQKGVWLVNDTIMQELIKLSTGEGSLLLKKLYDPPSRTILGRPIISCPDMPDSIVEGEDLLAFGDLSCYHITENPRWGLIRLEELYAESGLVGFLFEFYKGGYPANTEGLKILKVQASA